MVAIQWDQLFWDCMAQVAEICCSKVEKRIKINNHFNTRGKKKKKKN